MAVFTSSPALQARGIDISGVLDRAQQRKSRATTNALYQAKLQEQQRAQGRRGQFNALIPQIIAGDPSSIARGNALDPTKLAQITKFYAEADTRKKAEIKETLQTKVNLMETVMLACTEGADARKCQRMWTEGLRQAGELGLPIEGASPNFNEEEVRTKIAFGKAVLNKIEKLPDLPTGYRRKKDGSGMEIDPAYVRGEGELAAVKRAKGGGDLTALQKDVPYIAALMGVSLQDALNLKLSSRGKSYDDYVADIAGRYTTYGDRPEQAFEKAKGLADLVYGRVKPPPDAEPDSKEGRDWIDQLKEKIFGKSETGAAKPAAAASPAAKPKKAGAKPKVSQMSVEELTAHVKALKATGKTPPQAVLNEIVARMKELGVN